MMNKGEKRNMMLNYQPAKQKGEKQIKLFNCHQCGFHEKVMSKMWIEGYEDDVIVQCKSIHPNYVKIEFISNEHLKNDGKIVEELTCGMCGTVGKMLPVTGEILRMFGFQVDGKKEKSKVKASK
tara:strand:+ start:206 stop:577 length:372 start_codon:yes stop_codon:yes gene_type:complete